MQWLRWSAPGAILAAFLAAAPVPASATVFHWQIEGGIGTYLTGTGTLEIVAPEIGAPELAAAGTGAANAGGFEVIAFNGTIAGLQVSLQGGNPAGAAISPTGAFNYDNILYPAATGAMLDGHGLLLSVAGEEGNIWGNGAPGSYSYWRGTGPTYDYSNSAVTFTLVAALPGRPPTPSDPLGIPAPPSLPWLVAALLALSALHARASDFVRLRPSLPPPPPPAA